MVPPFSITLSPPAELSGDTSSGKTSTTQSTASERDDSNYAKYSTRPSSQATPFEELVHDGGLKSSGGEDKPIERRIKPQLIETSQSDGRLKQRRDSELENNSLEREPHRPQPIRPFAPQLFEPSRDTRFPDVTEGASSDKERLDRKRIFQPQLLETTRHSRRSQNTTSSLYADRHDAKSSSTPSLSELIPRKLRLNDEAQTSPKPVSVHSPSALSIDARKIGIIPPGRTLSQSSTHSHSYQGPGLETIESSESDSSAQQSPITSHSPSPISFSYISQVNRARECVDTHSGFLLARAARNAQKQLRDQALAAFPNDDSHEPINHYVDRFDATPAPSSRGSHYDADFLRRSSSNWELKEIQKHHEMLEVDREKEKKRRDARRKLYKHLDEHPFSAPVATSHCPAQAPESHRELQKMLEKARPPMLGKDLVFPRSQSPDSARFDVTQGPESLKKTMCYLSNTQDRSESSSPSVGGLWCAPPPPKPESVTSHQWSRPSSRAPSTQGGGLWGGNCLESGMSPPSSRPTGIMTPRFDEDELNAATKVGFNVPAAASAVLQNLPPSPPASTSGIASSFEGRLESPELPDAEETDEPEFSDRFITQVYNYLSLGYPAVARDYDDELSKISRIPVSELRADDTLTTGARGYIRLGEEELCEGVTEDMCARWKALKLYVLEWSKQQPNMSSKPKHVEGLWGAARKGSWAV